MKNTSKSNNLQWEKRIAVYMAQELYDFIDHKAAIAGLKPSTYIRHLLLEKMELSK